MLGSMLGGIAGGVTGGIADVGNFGVDTVMKVANFVGFKNIVSLGITTVGAVGGNEALAFAGVGSFIGGKSMLGTMVGTGAGFVVGSILQANEIADSAANTANETTNPNESSETLTSSTNRYTNNTAASIDDMMQTGTAPPVDNSEYGFT